MWGSGLQPEVLCFPGVRREIDVTIQQAERLQKDGFYGEKKDEEENGKAADKL